MQERAGVRERVERAGRRMIRGFMPEQHREFFAAQPLAFVGSIDARGRPWASLLAARPGFLHSPDPQTLRVDALPVPGDPLAANLAAGAPLGMLGIEFATRRRNRVNGTVAALDERGFELRVRQSFGNCPQYIQARSPLEPAAAAAQSAAPAIRAEAQLLSQPAQALVRGADTFFIATASSHAASADPVEGVDASHRGGKPGFVRVTEERGRSVLTVPDFAGNSSFNTFGNILVNPRAGLVFVDFDSGELLLLTGEAQVRWEGAELAAFAGAQRLLEFRAEQGWRFENACPLRWTAPVQAPQLAATGSWQR